MPLRAFGYVTSAARTALAHLPAAQVQIVHTINTASRVNGVDLERSRAEAVRFAGLGRLLLESTSPEVLPQITFLTDPTESLPLELTQITASLDTCESTVRERLYSSGARRGSDPVAYVAAHLQMHDTGAALLPLTENDPEPLAPSRIISLGAQSERPFYSARMACRDLELENRINETGQLFTRHVLPPYQNCRDGEMGMQDITEQLRLPFEIAHPTPSVARDLGYLLRFIQEAPHA